MLYTVMPLERIYARPASYADIRQARPENQQDTAYHEVLLPHGRVVTRREGENYIVDHVISTDMKDYLQSEYSPGKTIKG